MSEKETYIWEWISEVSEKRVEFGGNLLSPDSPEDIVSIQEVNIDDICPESGYDVVIFIVENFWRPHQIQKWVKFYNKKYVYYKFFADCAEKNIMINGVKTNNCKYNLILCQSKRKLSQTRKNLENLSYYPHWEESYLEEIFGNNYNQVKPVE
jgi:hypothetical protein